MKCMYPKWHSVSLINFLRKLYRAHSISASVYLSQFPFYRECIYIWISLLVEVFYTLNTVKFYGVRIYGMYYIYGYCRPTDSSYYITFKILVVDRQLYTASRPSLNHLLLLSQLLPMYLPSSLLRPSPPLSSLPLPIASPYPSPSLSLPSSL